MSHTPQPTFTLFNQMIKRPLVKDKEQDKLTDKKELCEASNDQDSLRSILDRLSSHNKQREYDDRELSFFGMEDESGQTVKVGVKREEAADFELQLQDLMAEAEDTNNELSVAEILFKLKDNFEIVDVRWPQIEQDEEVEQHASADNDDIELDFSPDGEDEGTGEETTTNADTQLTQVTDLLNKFIEVMQAETSARQAEADARKREAQMREQELAMQQTHSRIKQEEQMLDMETDMKARKEQDKEVKSLAQLAQWRSEQARDRGEEEDNEEIFPNLGTTVVTKSDTPLQSKHQARASRILGR